MGARCPNIDQTYAQCSGKWNQIKDLIQWNKIKDFFIKIFTYIKKQQIWPNVMKFLEQNICKISEQFNKSFEWLKMHTFHEKYGKQVRQYSLKMRKIQLKYKFKRIFSQRQFIKQFLIAQQIQIIQQLFDENFKNLLNKPQADKNVIFVGNTSAGKSKLLNKLFDLNLSVGKGETTQQFKCVYTINNINIFDSIGFNQQFNNSNKTKYRNQLTQINSCHLVFILFDSSLKSLKNLVELICKPKNRMYKVIFVYTKYDQWNKENNCTLDEEIKRQIQNLGTFGIENCNDYRFLKSSANQDYFQGGKNENDKIVKFIEDLKK